MTLLKPLIEQRADPHIFKHADGFYYFAASVPEYDRIELRRAPTLEGLANAAAVVVWRKPERGALSELIWAPEIHHHRGAWYVYFAAAPSREIKDDLFQHRMYAISTNAENPLEGAWRPPRQIETGMDSFSLDATTFAHRGVLYYVWAQKESGIRGNSNLYIAPMATPDRIAAAPVRLSAPELDWETRGFWVNEGPAVLIRNGRVFVSYSASATDENYCLGLLHADEDADLLNPDSWQKSPEPVFTTCYEHGVFGPGHNSFTVSEDGREVILVYHARTYREIVGDPLWNPDRHTFVKPVKWDGRGMPVFGEPCGAS
ncbi:MAG TPA: glycoside hydrolase family 43 protein [Thermoanaerobaculales bacterium]|nr:glycoside hydrolase family 43 protein [Thermoanaerobaculales bacterium]HPA81983.1 glycoside hydrolase family 43 protein [Thermoanaerobaculales bacterium]HQL29279.1 glycoside hydrolase family 43 protein [Thermoanaerobaculales bacterium]